MLSFQMQWRKWLNLRGDFRKVFIEEVTGVTASRLRKHFPAKEVQKTTWSFYRAMHNKGQFSKGMDCLLSVHNFSFLLSHKAFREISNTGKRGERNKFFLTNRLSYMLLLCFGWFTPFPTQYTYASPAFISFSSQFDGYFL